MLVKEAEKNLCFHQTHGLIQQKYTAGYSNFPSVKEENKKQGPGIRNVCVRGQSDSDLVTWGRVQHRKDPTE